MAKYRQVEDFLRILDRSIAEAIDKGQVRTPTADDPLRVVVNLTAPQAAKLKKGDTLDVRYKIDPSDAWQQATVEALAPVAAAGALFG